MRGSSTKACAIATSASMNRLKIGGKPPAASASLQIFCTAMAHRGVFGEGFQMQTSPQTAAMNAFQLHTATGKLKALMMPTTPSGCHCSYMR
jgi:hypothetical protein